MNSNWWKDVEAILEEKSVLKHEFYKAWTNGMLTMDDLARYSRQYYRLEAGFPRFVENAISSCGDERAREALAANLRDELGEEGRPSHRELWLGFAESVGADRASVEEAESRPETQECVETFERLSKSGWVSGASALYAYEAQQPAVARTKMDGLRSRYGLESEKALAFFQAHEKADEWHSDEEKKALLRAVEAGEASGEQVLDAVNRACDALNALLDGVWAECDARKTCTTC
jgi:pyrroloquinoline-quinone synthase